MNKTLLASAVLALALGVSGAAFANKATAPGQNKTCLITFGSHADATAGADATILSAKYLPVKAATVQQTYTAGGSVRIFDYTLPGNLTNDQERKLCDSLNPPN
jgi:hypothetical protein